MDGEYRQRIDIELTESEAECLLNLVLSMEKIVQDNIPQDQPLMVDMLFARLVAAFPGLIENDKAISFLEQHGYDYGNGGGNGYGYEGVSNDKALVMWDRMVMKKIEQRLTATRGYIKTELAKLDAREIFIESYYIRLVLGENVKYTTERLRLAEIWRRIGADMDYKIIKERKYKLKSELAKISGEIAALSNTLRASVVPQ